MKVADLGCRILRNKSYIDVSNSVSAILPLSLLNYKDILILPRTRSVSDFNETNSHVNMYWVAVSNILPIFMADMESYPATDPAN